MKQLIKKIVPRPVLQTAIDIRDKRRLRIVPEQGFDSSHLKRANDIDLSTIFSDKEIEKTWNSDHENITSILGEDYIFDGINSGDRRALYCLITALKPEKVLEVGTHIGASTLYISRALKNISSDSIVTTVDILDVNAEHAPWKKLGLEMPPREFAKKLGSLDYIDFQASHALDFLRDLDKKFDFSFLDGDHSSQAVYKEVSIALTLLNPNGVILLHDYYPEAKQLFSNGHIIAGPFRALDRVKKEGNDIYVKPLGNLPWPTKLESNATSLAVVTRA